MANVIVGGVEQAMLEQEFKNAANEDGKMTVSLTGLQMVYGAAGVGVEASRILEKMREKELVAGHCLELADFWISRSLWVHVQRRREYYRALPRAPLQKIHAQRYRKFQRALLREPLHKDVRMGLLRRILCQSFLNYRKRQPWLSRRM